MPDYSAKTMHSKYRRGASFEQRVKRYLEGAGFFVVRAAQSKGLADLVALRGGEGSADVHKVNVKLSLEVRLVSCRLHGVWGRQEKEDLYALVEKLGPQVNAFLASRGAPPHYLIKMERLEAPQ